MFSFSHTDLGNSVRFKSRSWQADKQSKERRHFFLHFVFIFSESFRRRQLVLNSYVLEFQNVVRPPFAFSRFFKVRSGRKFWCCHTCVSFHYFSLQKVDSLICEKQCFSRAILVSMISFNDMIILDSF